MNVTWKLRWAENPRSGIIIEFILDKKITKKLDTGSLWVWAKNGGDYYDIDGFLIPEKVNIDYTYGFLYYTYYDSIVKDVKKLLVKEML